MMSLLSLISSHSQEHHFCIRNRLSISEVQKYTESIYLRNQSLLGLSCSSVHVIQHVLTDCFLLLVMWAKILLRLVSTFRSSKEVLWFARGLSRSVLWFQRSLQLTHIGKTFHLWEISAISYHNSFVLSSSVCQSVFKDGILFEV